MWCGGTNLTCTSARAGTHSCTQAIRCFMQLWIWRYNLIPSWVSRCACASIWLGFLDRTSILVHSQQSSHKSRWDLQQGSWSRESWENSKRLCPRCKSQAGGELWELWWCSVVLLFLWWILMFTICTYVEHRQHLVRQEVGNPHDGLSARKPFLYTDSI